MKRRPRRRTTWVVVAGNEGQRGVVGRYTARATADRIARVLRDEGMSVFVVSAATAAAVFGR